MFKKWTGTHHALKLEWPAKSLRFMLISSSYGFFVVHLIFKGYWWEILTKISYWRFLIKWSWLQDKKINKHLQWKFYFLTETAWWPVWLLIIISWSEDNLFNKILHSEDKILTKRPWEAYLFIKTTWWDKKLLSNLSRQVKKLIKKQLW
jgi:hypothetical protein